MGSSKKQTVGYWYYMGLHMGICHGPVDSVLEIRAGDRTAWTGNVTQSGQITISAENLFGGKEKEGGIYGRCDIMMGEADQGPNAYLSAKQSGPQPAYRGFLGLVYHGSGSYANLKGNGSLISTLFLSVLTGLSGKIAANNPYIKPWAVKVKRILKGWDADSAWYPEKAAVSVASFTIAYSDDWKYRVEAPGSTADYSAKLYDDSEWSVGPGGFGTEGWSGGVGPGVGTVVTSGIGKAIWLRKRIESNGAVDVIIDVYHDDGPWLWWNGSPVALTPQSESYHSRATIPAASVLSVNTVALKVMDGVPSGTAAGFYAGMALTSGGGGLVGMNPAHIIYECLTNREWGLGYPAGKLDLDSFEAAADTFYAEGMGLCLQWTQQDSIQNFIQLVVDHAGAAIGEDPRTGLFKLKAIRADYDLDTLPEFSPAAGNIISLDGFDRASLTETINEISVTYTDATTGLDGSISVQQLANIQAQGAVVPQGRNYPGLPTVDLALRVALRDLKAAASALARVRMTVTRAAWALSPGDVIKFVWPELSIGSMALRVVRVDYGSLTDGAIKLECVEDVFGLPDSTYVSPPAIGWEEPDGTPQPSAAISAFEVPYRELFQTLSQSDAENLPADAGYLATVALRPAGVALNYELGTRVGSADYAQAGTGDWCPSATLSTNIGPLTTSIVLTNVVELVAFEVGNAIFIGTEICRVDTIDTATNTITVGRGCCDTVPAAWPAGTRVWAYDEYSTADGKQYVDGETVDAKVITVSSQGVLDETAAPVGSVTMDSRAARPYPPGLVRFADVVASGQAYPAELIGATTTSWAHRDRKLQQDQLIDENDASIGPEAGTTYTVRYYQPENTLVNTQSGISGTSATPYTFPANGRARITVEAVRDGLGSWQRADHSFDYLTAPLNTRIVVGGDTRVTTDGDTRASLG